MYRHQLLDEAKAELDLVFEEIRRAEASSCGRGADIAELWRLQAETVRRFDVLSRAFAVASVATDPDIAAGELLATLFPCGADADAAAAAERFCRGLRAFRDGGVGEDPSVRTAWSAIESRLVS